jgi:hypothetical protein
MDAKALSGRIDKFEDSFRALAEAGLFASERPAQSAAPRRPPRLRPTPLERLAAAAVRAFLARRPREPLAPTLVPPAPEPPRTSSERIAASIRQARDLVEAKQLARAAEELTRAEIALERELYLRSRLWRFVRVHQGPVVLYYLLCLAALAVLGLGRVVKPTATLWGVPASILVLASAGAVLRGLYWLQVQVSRRVYRVQFMIAHFAAPWIGVLLGVGAYLLTRAGLLTVEGSAPAAAPAAGHEGTLLALAAFLAGWNWTWLIGRLNLGRASASAASEGGATGGTSA